MSEVNSDAEGTRRVTPSRPKNRVGSEPATRRQHTPTPRAATALPAHVGVCRLPPSRQPTAVLCPVSANLNVIH